MVRGVRVRACCGEGSKSERVPWCEREARVRARTWEQAACMPSRKAGPVEREVRVRPAAAPGWHGVRVRACCGEGSESEGVRWCVKE